MEKPSPKSRKRKTKEPCPGCYLHKDICMCDLIPELKTTTHLSLIIHSRELKRTTNTGRLALKALTNSSMHIRGRKDEPLDFSNVLLEGYQPLLLFPCEEAELLDTDFVQAMDSSLPVQLIVPDGNWRQASKVNTRYPALKHVPRVKLKLETVETQFLRTETVADGMATLQSIAFALGELEGAFIQEQLEKVYREKLTRTLKARGQL